MTTTENAPRVPTALNGVADAIARHGDLGRRWLEGMWRGDPLADAVVDNGAAMVRRAIVGGIESLQNPPAALVDLFGQLDSRPDWFDADRCDRAAGHLARHSREYGFVLGAASLLAGAQNSIAGKPLVFTGRYAGNAAIRSIEVGSWLAGATTPGGLRREADGFEQTVRVRMIHAHIRVQLARDGDWDMAAWGLPIPQSYMSFTLAEFCSVALGAMRQLGVRYRDAELEDIHHLWRYVGHVVGVDDDFLPVTPNDYARIEDLYALTAVSPDDHDRKFVAALTDFQAAELARFVPRRWSHPIIHGLQRALVGDAIASDLAIPQTRWKHLPRLLGPVIALGYAAHDRLVPEGKARRTARGLQYRSDELARLRAHYAVAHELVDDVAR
jgi:ER-bound oxygenase mpaB/B'/Rubber oxygenase, catalytic domain